MEIVKSRLGALIHDGVVEELVAVYPDDNGAYNYTRDGYEFQLVPTDQIAAVGGTYEDGVFKKVAAIAPQE